MIQRQVGVLGCERTTKNGFKTKSLMSGLALLLGFGLGACAAPESGKRGFVQKNIVTQADAAALPQSSALEASSGNPADAAPPGVEAPPAVEAAEKRPEAGPGAEGDPKTVPGPVASSAPSVPGAPVVSPDPAASSSSACVAGASSVGVPTGKIAAATGVNVRKGPQVSAERIGGLDDKTKVTIWKSVGTAPNVWSCVSAAGAPTGTLTGWVSGAHIERDPPPPTPSL